MKNVQEKPVFKNHASQEIDSNPKQRKNLQRVVAPPPRSPVATALVEHLQVGLQSETNQPTDERCVLLNKEVSGYRLVLIREKQAPALNLNLSPREQEIVRMIAKGYPNKTIAAELDISPWTVGTHLRRVFAKLGVTCRAAMVARLMDLGFSHLLH
jgi:DNA-binding NarL/FixJ family response regulator